jgi:2-iminobutanoate/2-iminopropanoate deaminase
MRIRFVIATFVILALVVPVSMLSQQKEIQPGAAMPQTARQTIATKDAPPAAGPYSQAIKAGGFIFVAGQVGRDPATGKMVEGDITVQTDRVLKNITAVLIAAGTSTERVVKTTVFLKNISDFSKMNDVYGTYFKTAPPARSTVGANLPSDALVEIEVVALQ